MSQDIPWWKKTTVYQIYPRSYKDSTGNGIGDLRGIINKLDYIHDLGVESIWFSPFFSSPQDDCGYDISNYRDIAPEYGTMKDCEELIAEIHKRGMKIVMDMVMNHTSIEHEWFRESRSSRDNPKRDWYIWKDGKKPKGKAPPNNWKAMIGGSGWHYDEATDQWFWSQFLPFQPDLNYRNPEVKEEMFNTVRFWLDKGVDGFRLDIVNTIYEDAEIRDYPWTWKPFNRELLLAPPFHDPLYSMNHPDTFTFMKELRAVVDEYSNPSRFLVGEIDGPYEKLQEYCGGKAADGLHTTFLFQSLGVPLTAKKVKMLISEFETYFPDPLIPTWVFANHDRPRRISRLGDDISKAKLNTALQLTARGIPYIYYGEEIGMMRDKIPMEDANDQLAWKFRKIVPQFIMDLVWKFFKESLNRDECRTPMQWTPDATAGFSPDNVPTWLPITSTYKQRNVESQQDNPDSLYHCYKRFLQVRKDHPALNSGALSLVSENELPPNVLAYSRSSGEEVVYVYLNFSNKAVKIPNPLATPYLIASTHEETHSIGISHISLLPHEAIVIGDKF